MGGSRRRLRTDRAEVLAQAYRQHGERRDDEKDRREFPCREFACCITSSTGRGSLVHFSSSLEDLGPYVTSRWPSRMTQPLLRPERRDPHVSSPAKYLGENSLPLPTLSLSQKEFTAAEEPHSANGLPPLPPAPRRAPSLRRGLA